MGVGDFDLTHRFSFPDPNDNHDEICAIGAILADLSLGRAEVDVKGVAYEELVRNTFDKGDNQQFFTPREIAEFAVALAKHKLDGANICDPASGTGGFLVEILRKDAKPKKLLALEVDDRLAWVSGINLFLAGAVRFESIFLGNGGSLGSRGAQFFNTFDLIITNPPFGSDYSDPTLAQYVLGNGYSSRRRGVLFIERCLDMLKEGGILVMVIDEGVLSLPSSKDVREFIRSRSNLLAVVSLPETAFMPYALVNTSILVIEKAKHPDPDVTTFFARSESIGRKPNGETDVTYTTNGEPVANSDLPEIIAAWREFRSSGRMEGGHDRFFASKPFSTGACGEDFRLDFRYHHPARLMAQNSLATSEYPLVYLAEICVERGESLVPSVDLPDELIYYTGLAQMEARTGNASQIQVPAQSIKSAVKRYKQGDILFAKMRPNLRKCAFMEFAHEGYASSECVVLMVQNDSAGSPKIDPQLLSILLRSDLVYGQLMHKVAGIGRPRLSPRDLLKVRLPLPPREVQLTLKNSFIQSQEIYVQMDKQAEQLRRQSESMKLSSVENVARNLCGVKTNYSKK